MVSVARSRHIRGPFIGAPHNPVFTHRSTRDPVQNVGHADLVDLPDGSWAAVHLGVRNRGTSPRFHVNGRETFLAGVTWVSGWPVFSETAFTAARRPLAFDDHFDSPELHPRWVSPGIAPAELTTRDPRGIRVRPGEAPSGEPSGLFARVAGDSWRTIVELDMDAQSECTVLLRVDASHWYGLEVLPDHVLAISQVGAVRAEVGRAQRLDTARISLAISSVSASSGGPDDVELALLDQDERWSTIARLDGRYLSTEVAGGFTGRVVGVTARTGSVLVERVVFTSVLTSHETH